MDHAPIHSNVSEHLQDVTLVTLSMGLELVLTEVIAVSNVQTIRNALDRARNAMQQRKFAQLDWLVSQDHVQLIQIVSNVRPAVALASINDVFRSRIDFLRVACSLCAHEPTFF